MDESNDSRYAEILRRIEQKQREEAQAPLQADLSAVLDGLNAAGFLSVTRKQRLKAVSAYGPKMFRGYIPAWVGTTIWYKPRGYYHYQVLTLLGVWALNIAEEGTLVMVGTRTLNFKAAVFNAESYYHHIRRRFDIYYDGDASPPSRESCLYQRLYDASARLEMRGQLDAVLAEWSARLNTAEADDGLA